MTTLDQLRKAALGLPEVEETTHLGMLAFAVRGRSFVDVTGDGVVQLHLPAQETDAVLVACPAAERLVRMGKAIGIRVPLTAVDGKELNDLVKRAWASRAPKRLAASLAAIDRNEVPVESNLPREIGRPATRALLTAGITTLDDVAKHSERELLALHGVGPRAVKILRAALAEQGRRLR